jgi:hypothetical protein
MAGTFAPAAGYCLAPCFRAPGGMGAATEVAVAASARMRAFSCAVHQISPIGWAVFGQTREDTEAAMNSLLTGEKVGRQ